MWKSKTWNWFKTLRYHKLYWIKRVKNILTFSNFWYLSSIQSKKQTIDDSIKKTINWNLPLLRLLWWLFLFTSCAFGAQSMSHIEKVLVHDWLSATMHGFPPHPSTRVTSRDRWRRPCPSPQFPLHFDHSPHFLGRQCTIGHGVVVITTVVVFFIDSTIKKNCILWKT